MTALDVKALTLRGTQSGDAANLLAAVTSGSLTTSIAEASSLTLTVQDDAKTLTRSGLLDAASWIDFDGYRYQLATFRGQGQAIELGFVDVVAARMAAKTGHLQVPAGTLRSAFLARLAREVGVPATVEKSSTPVRNPLERASVDDPAGESSWVATGRLADEVGWRRFSTGTSMVAGSDAWLLGRRPPVTLQEGVGAVDAIDWEIDTGQKTSSATVTADVDYWGVKPGLPVRVLNEGPASGLWLVESVEQAYGVAQATITLTRATQELAEPKASTAGDAGGGAGLPGDSGSDLGGKAYSAHAETMIAWGKARTSLPYVYGAKGPNAYDCSGFVSAAIRAAGGSLAGSVSGLWAACQAHHTTTTAANGAATRGALLFGLGTGAGSSGNHIAISLGNGQTLEAKSRADGIGVFNGGASWHGWTGAALVPGF